MAALAAFVAVSIVTRVAELVVTARHTPRLKARGARAVRPDAFPLLVVVHVLFPLCLVAEVLWLGARPGPTWPAWLGLWFAAQVLRVASIRALGERWTARVWVLSGVPLVETGPYRFLRHPSYVAVVVDLAAGPLVFGAWRTTLVISLLNAVALRRRIRAEDRALS